MIFVYLQSISYNFFHDSRNFAVRSANSFLPIWTRYNFMLMNASPESDWNHELITIIIMPQSSASIRDSQRQSLVENIFRRFSDYWLLFCTSKGHRWVVWGAVHVSSRPRHMFTCILGHFEVLAYVVSFSSSSWIPNSPSVVSKSIYLLTILLFQTDVIWLACLLYTRGVIKLIHPLFVYNKQWPKV